MSCQLDNNTPFILKSWPVTSEIFIFVPILSGGDSASEEHATMEDEQKQLPMKEANGRTMPSDNVDSKIQAARRAKK